MFASGGIIMILGVLLSILIIGSSVYYVYKLFATDTKEVLVRFILLVFTSLVAVFIVDKIIAFKLKLLTEDQDDNLFDLIKTLVLMIFSYYFGTKSDK
jgi:ABC-type Co2+ transport system permease subunit